MSSSFAPISAGSLTALPWEDFFQRREMINDEIPLYLQGSEGTVFLCLHGAGHSALSFASLAQEFKDTPVIIAAFDFRQHGDNI
mmetsp:Transcript_20832/g.3370  ORF Transcript_20832/g.3370 Transcript_20832/m.3370 type:complete len:84 (-) Transcript_20832:683-934(-)